LLCVATAPFQQDCPSQGDPDVFGDPRLEPLQQLVGRGDRAASHEAARDHQAGGGGRFTFGERGGVAKRLPSIGAGAATKAVTS
jgi:hypothetical protein